MTNKQKNNCRGAIQKAVLYTRFSSDNQREESIEAQLRAIHEYCERKGIIILHEYCDRAKSATTDNRPEFLQMISDAKNDAVSYTHLRAHETRHDLVCRLLLEKKKKP